MVVTKTYQEPPVCKKEILRYAGCKGESEATVQALLEECLEEVLPKLSYKVCYMELPLGIKGNTCDFGCMKLESKDLVKNLQGCEKIILFAATIGVEIDRFIQRYGHLSPAKAMMMQAIGAERIESLCDAFCSDLESGTAVPRPRFSPGYGDLPLEIQKDIFAILSCSKHIGLSLNDSLLMSPTKSVTAFVGMQVSDMNRMGNDKAGKEKKHSCLNCSKTDCAYRMIETRNSDEL